MVKAGLSAAPATLDYAVSLLSMQRRLDDFGNAGECSSLLDRAKTKLSARKAAAARGGARAAAQPPAGGGLPGG